MTSYGEELAHYEAQVAELRRGQLKAVQTTATRWSALMAGLLGVFGTVAFAGGLTTLDKLPAGAGTLIRVITTLAALAAVAAIWFLARAAGGLRLADLKVPNAKTLMAREAVLISDGRKHLRTGRACALATAGLVLAGSVIVLWVPAEKSPARYLVRFPDGARCDVLTRAGDRLTVGGRDVREAAEIIPVTACPKVTPSSR